MFNGTLIILLLWIYINAIILLIGFELNVLLNVKQRLSNCKLAIQMSSMKKYNYSKFNFKLSFFQSIKIQSTFKARYI